jgi:glutamine cyclotransferase
MSALALQEPDQAELEKLKSYKVKQLKALPHEGSPWTQGLEFRSDGSIVETSGDYPAGVGSLLRVLDPQSGEVTATFKEGLEKSTFLEGITEFGGHWFLTTYNDKVALEYDEAFHLVGKHPFPWEGWGLTRSADGQSFITTNGTEYVMRLNPRTFELEDVKTAACLGKRVTGLNELELIDDFLGQGPALLGNIVNTRLVLVLDPATMKCTGAFHLRDLEEPIDREQFGFHVANGIAYDRVSGNFIFTGKNWNNMYEAQVASEPSAGSPALKMLSQHLSAAPRLDQRGPARGY